MTVFANFQPQLSLYFAGLRALKPMTVKSFRQKTNTSKAPTDEATAELEYWASVGDSKPLYGADVDASLLHKDSESFNLRNLGTILDLEEKTILGVTTPYLYFGTWLSTFPWHVEDKNLYSINFLHQGEAKFWYGVSAGFGKRFEQVVSKLLPDQHENCAAFLRHKSTVVAPEILEARGIPVVRACQRQ
ncbi:lysine-specific demethylase 4E-like, partial [Galendromus occidentalis]|uniref:Lysine-specific demethylase 4E-like n=1 Tax=Galendromus occidentalis TaxID=34638 RepID=A0AAJ6QSK5_9ACAR